MNDKNKKKFLSIKDPFTDVNIKIQKRGFYRGFNVPIALHAVTVCETYQRSKLERLCRYITRPPIATRRLLVDDRGRVMYRYKQPFRDGSTHVVLEPLDFIARLAPFLFHYSPLSILEPLS
jgi:hypothetical protein